MFKQVFDAGHYPNTAGKRTPDGMKEYEFNSAVVKECKRIIESEYDGVLVIFTHSDARDVPLTERATHANNMGADAFTSVHANAFGSTWNDANGIETFTSKGSSKMSVELATKVQAQLVKDTGLRNRGTKKENFTVLTKTKMPAILVECGFMTNKKEATLLKSDAYRKKVARSLVTAHALQFKWKKKTSAPKPTPAPSTDTMYRVVTGSFSNQKNAQDRVNVLKKAGFDSFIDVYKK